MSDKCSSHLFLSTGNCCVFFFLGNFNFGSGGDVSGGVVGGGRGVASRGGGGRPLKHSGVYISGNGHCLIVTWRHKHFDGCTQFS